MTFDNDKWKEQQKKDLEKGNKALQKAAPKFPIPEGYTGKWGKDESWMGIELLVYVVADASGEIEFRFRNGGAGTCRFKSGDSWRTFDRRGVDDSFYWIHHSYTKGKPDRVKSTDEINEIYKNLLDKIAKSREYSKTAIAVPQIGFTVSPATKEEYSKKLKAGGYVQFYPSGFGTGYTISARKLYSYSTPASAALCEFFGCSRLYVSTMDCD